MPTSKRAERETPANFGSGWGTRRVENHNDHELRGCAYIRRHQLDPAVVPTTEPCGIDVLVGVHMGARAEFHKEKEG